MDTQLRGNNQYPHSTGKFKPQLSVLWVLPCSGDFGVQKAKTEACGAAVALCLSCDSSCGGNIWSLTQVSSRCWQAARHMLGKLSVCFPHQHVTHFVLTHRAGLPCVWANWLWLGQSPRGPGELHIHTFQLRLATSKVPPKFYVTPLPPATLGCAPQWAPTQPCQGHCRETAECKAICADTGCLCRHMCAADTTIPAPGKIFQYPYFFNFYLWWKGWVGEIQQCLMGSFSL